MFHLQPGSSYYFGIVFDLLSGSYKVQEGCFYPLVEGGGLPEIFFFFEKRMQMVQSAPFLGRLLVNIFSKIATDFCHDFE